MKLLLIFLALTTLISCKKESGCIDHEKYACELIDLSDEYDPVCDCNGKTYQNAGYAQCVGGITKYREGKCK